MAADDQKNRPGGARGRARATAVVIAARGDAFSTVGLPGINDELDVQSEPPTASMVEVRRPLGPFFYPDLGPWIFDLGQKNGLDPGLWSKRDRGGGGNSWLA